MTGIAKTIKHWFHRAETDAEEIADGAEPVTSRAGDEEDVETSTNAQVGGASGELYPGED
jgi:hypothetical protein